jgi:hypothetical protein
MHTKNSTHLLIAQYQEALFVLLTDIKNICVLFEVVHSFPMHKAL